jgi:hypothetical protein
MGGWAGATATRMEIPYSPTSGPIIYPDGGIFPDGAVSTGYDVGRLAYAIGDTDSYGGMIWSVDNPTKVGNYQAMAMEFAAIPLAETSTAYNCECEEVTHYSTLIELRRRLLVRLGYAAQVDNPPPGMTVLLNDFLLSAQKFMYDRFKALRTERFYQWTMAPGVRFYDLEENEDTCVKRMNAYKVSWVGVEDLNGAWTPLVKGIPPELYTSINFQGLPSRYEIRQCIEVFPAPSESYILRIKAHFGLEPFDEDGDVTTIDSELVFLWALANAKAHYGQADAGNIAEQANTMLGQLVAGTHQTGRYVPGSSSGILVPSAPIFLPLA